MNVKLYDKLLRRSYKLRHLVDYKYIHFAYVTDGNKILSVGFNKPTKSHPLAYAYNKNSAYVHAEAAAIISFNFDLDRLRHCDVYSIRINKNGCPMLAKPCKICEKILLDFNLRSVYYSGMVGELVKLW